jgi:hypothetical protein
MSSFLSGLHLSWVGETAAAPQLLSQELQVFSDQ